MIRLYRSPASQLRDYNRMRERTYSKSGNFQNDADDLMTLEQALTDSGMTDYQRKLLRMYYVEEYSQPEIALIVNKSQATVSITINRAEKHLHNLFQNWERMELNEHSCT
ncbi:sigma-70 family RNA polymerase sigma factor [Listeria newyorkensis]|uniref:Sigma-70 family RNA polymerase sigma factor n=1 Tax=Listeria newyorkensis TaxID=1497681 RepID=A0A841YRH9_9LIST|nr:sigma-70 family RNA polymerase sigma factor [Listeria newyorkensis]MBC1456271.1 sigma-70 family RNA polymerase sigma factor [Listeria newyorkensis]